MNNLKSYFIFFKSQTFLYTSLFLILIFYSTYARAVPLYQDTSTNTKVLQQRLSENELKILFDAPATHVGHGSIFDASGNTLKFNEKLLNQTQAFWLSVFEEQKGADQFGKLRAIIFDLVEDPYIAKSLEIDALTQNKQDFLSLKAKALNNALRSQYLYENKIDFTSEKLTPWGIPYNVSEILERYGLDQPKAITEKDGEEYIAECREAGVPIPPPMYTDGWQNRGVFTTEFISEDLVAELWLYEGEDIGGACLALPRYFSDTDDTTTRFFGLICLGKESNNACFWDNPSSARWPRNEARPIEDFVGGAALAENGQGTCTDCHAGENPFVVHPDVVAFSGLTSVLGSDDWYEPIVAATWPQNPGPIDLSSIDSEQSCDSCHSQGFAGRFPDVTAGLTGYCGDVLKTSLLGDTDSIPPRAIQTMPQSGSFAGHIGHIDYLLSLCYGGTTPGGNDDDREEISPPIVIGPLYACATKLAVAGTILDAEVSVYVDGALVGTKISRSPSQLDFDVPELEVGQIVTAEQKIDGIASGFSNSVTVRDHKIDYPSGLPAPEIDPELIYECGHTVAARHVPGAILTIKVNGGDERSTSSSTGWTGMYPAKNPFDLNDEFTAEISLCEDRSGISDPIYAVAAPAVTSAPSTDPAELFDGQELINIVDVLHGSMVEVGESSVGMFDKFSTPISWMPERDVRSKLGRSLLSGDNLLLQQTLCDEGPIGELPPVRECESLPTPRIRIPFEGDTQVFVTESVPGARIRIFVGSDEIGDGSGNLIALERALIRGETLVVTQVLSDCFSRLAYTITVQDRPEDKNENEDKKG